MDVTGGSHGQGLRDLSKTLNSEPAAVVETRDKKNLVDVLRLPDVIDAILTQVQLKDQGSLQLTSKEYQACVVIVMHSGTWDERCIRIDENNAEQIALFRPLRLWTAATVKLPISESTIVKVEHILKTLKHLNVTWHYDHVIMCSTCFNLNRKRENASNNMRFLLTNCQLLTSLYLDCQIMDLVQADVFAIIRNVVPNLRHFEITKPHCGYIIHDYPQLSTNLTFLSTLKWNKLTTLKLHAHFPCNPVLLTGDVVNKLTTLHVRCSDCYWLHVPLIQNLKEVSVSIPAFCERPRPVCENFGQFLQKQRLLTSLEIQVEPKIPFPKDLIQAIASRSSELRELALRAHEFEDLTVESLKFLDEAKYLQKLSLHVGTEKPESDVSMLDIYGIFKTHKNITVLNLTGFRHGLQLEEHQKPNSVEEWDEFNKNLSKLARSFLPKLISY